MYNVNGYVITHEQLVYTKLQRELYRIKESLTYNQRIRP